MIKCLAIHKPWAFQYGTFSNVISSICSDVKCFGTHPTAWNTHLTHFRCPASCYYTVLIIKVGNLIIQRKTIKKISHFNFMKDAGP